MKIHFMGIGGSGASAAAAIAQAQGYQVTGCDINPLNEFTKHFDPNQLFVGHSPSHLTNGNTDLVVISPAVTSLDPNNEEILEAKQLKIAVLTWQEFMGKYLEKDKFVIAVCGTHGKSTTTAMIGQMLEEAGFDPTVELGAIVPKWGRNYRVGKLKYFVTEADEFNNNFLASQPDITVVTAIEMDHPEFFVDFENYKNSFHQFLAQTKNKIIANMSDKGILETLALSDDLWRGKVIDYSQKLINFPLFIPGEFNKLNASAAYQVGLSLGIKPEVIQKSLSSFQGIGRRFEYLGEYLGAKIYSDFGHHPTEIKVTLEAARQKFPQQKIIVIFQPHMFSRTYALLPEFVKVFQELPVALTYVLDIYPSREVDTGLVSSKQLVDNVARPNVTYLPGTDLLFQKLATEVKKDAVIFFIGAGDTDKWARQLINKHD